MVVFEGFFDFLSWVQICLQKGHAKPLGNNEIELPIFAIVMNSKSNWRSTIDACKNFSRVYYMGDIDDAITYMKDDSKVRSTVYLELNKEAFILLDERHRFRPCKDLK